MKITYLKLTNFINIVTAFKTETIEIDFSEAKNDVILLTGPNGSGKTSILSCLHPFATNGNLDVRDSNPLIVAKKDGYKEIHIENGNDLYIIQHFYTPKSPEGFIIKSYIQKNGLELNGNGNVTSFKEIIQKELGIEMDYMKFAREHHIKFVKWRLWDSTIACARNEKDLIFEILKYLHKKHCLRMLLLKMPVYLTIRIYNKCFGND